MTRGKKLTFSPRKYASFFGMANICSPFQRMSTPVTKNCVSPTWIVDVCPSNMVTFGEAMTLRGVRSSYGTLATTTFEPPGGLRRLAALAQRPLDTLACR